MDISRKPNMNFILKLFKLQNWRKLRPAEETKLKRTQYTATTIGNGTEAEKGSNCYCIIKQINGLEIAATQAMLACNYLSTCISLCMLVYA
ncbi:hypothetical protein GOBAR_DD06826 [Gossypium barbadense]|nr:hypothetical protein GOBAR_DD06826 [Gossypium barbadense]